MATLSLLMLAIGLRPAGPVAQLAMIAAMLVFYIAMRRAKLSATQLRDRDRRAPVLILRQFGDDFLEAGRVSLGGTPTFEHFVAGELNRIGPVIAIGRPGERLQPLGASRDYLADGDWQRAVTTTIEEAALVVFVLGDSENLLWEFRKTIETHGKRRTLIVVPPLRDRAELARRWSGFVRASADLLGAGLPSQLPVALGARHRFCRRRCRDDCERRAPAIACVAAAQPVGLPAGVTALRAAPARRHNVARSFAELPREVGADGCVFAAAEPERRRRQNYGVTGGSTRRIAPKVSSVNA